ncbi:MAG: metal ABC transporter ATP-binding protein [Alphaproteobacteria bacterium]|nr:metal ABC transporter ATP-binding protein [Alphaproteobacteria bacterium]
MDAIVKNGQAPLMALSGAGVRRAGRWLVRNVDLQVQPGEIVTLIGPNGSGKSTTVKMAIGLFKPDEGLSTRKPGLTIGYVPQKLNIDRTLPLTVRRLLTLGAHHSPSAVTETLDAVGIARLADAQVQNLSGGEFQRALLARAMIGKPDILVLDEPVQGVDFAGEIALYDLIQEIRETTGCGILLISHDLHMVMAATDTVICLNGHVCCTGSPDAVAADPEYVRLFGKQASETLAIYRHDHDHVHLSDGRVRHSDGTVTDHCHPGDGHHHDEPDSPPKEHLPHA